MKLLLNIVSFSLLISTCTFIIACNPDQTGLVPQLGSTNGSAHTGVSTGVLTDAYAQMQLTYGNKYDKGVKPSVAINLQGQIVEVHKSQNTNYLFYRTAQVVPSATSIQWSSSTNLANNLGKIPAVALGKNLCVIMWLSDFNTVDYKVGNWRNGKLEFNGTRNLDLHGDVPTALSICIDAGSDEYGGDIAIAYSSRSNSTIYMRYGRVGGGQINLNGYTQYYDEGLEPTIAFNNKRQVIMMYVKIVNGDRRVYARAGDLYPSYNGPARIDWQPEPVYVTLGVRPQVALDDAGNVVSVYTSYSTVHRRIGYLQKKSYSYIGICSSYNNTSYDTALRTGEYGSVSLALVGGRTQVIANIDDGSKQLFSATNGL